MNCRRFFKALVASAAVAAISAADPEPSKPFELTYDYDTVTPLRIYADGELLKQYATDEIMWISKATQSPFTNTYAVTVPALNRSAATLTATALFWNGTNMIESAQNEAVQLQFRPRAVGMLQPLDLINDEAAIERIVQEATRSALSKNEALRSLFETAESQLDTLSHAAVIDPPAVLVKRYPVGELKGEARLLMKQFERGDAINPRAVVLAVLKGLRAGTK